MALSREDWDQGAPCEQHEMWWCSSCKPSEVTNELAARKAIQSAPNPLAERGPGWQQELGTQLALWFRSEPPRGFDWRDDPSPWSILLAGFLLQSTTGAQVQPTYRSVIRDYPTPAHLADEDPERLRSRIHHLGLSERAGWIVACARAIVDHHHGEVPSSEADLRSLPGVGPQRAAAVRCFAYGEPEPVVGVTTGRMLRRILGLSETHKDDAVFQRARPMVPKDDPVAFNYALVDIAGELCKPAGPRCAECPAQRWCASRQ